MHVFRCTCTAIINAWASRCENSHFPRGRNWEVLAVSFSSGLIQKDMPLHVLVTHSIVCYLEHLFAFPVHDATMNKFSVKNQFCNVATGNWHETVFMGSEDCREAFWSKAVDLTFTSDSCVGGFILKECSFQPCTKDSGDRYIIPHVVGGLLRAEHNMITERTQIDLTT